MIKIASSLSGAGFEVILLGLRKSDSIATENRPYRQKRLRMWFQHGKFFYIEGHIRIFLYLLFTRADMYCAIDMDTLLPCYFASRLRRKKLVFDAHEYYSETSGLVGRKTEKRVWQRLEDMFIPKLQYAYTVNHSLAQIFTDKYNVPFQVIRNLPYRISPEKKWEQDKYFIYQGALNKGRGLEALLTAFQNSDQTLKIAGNGPMMPWLKQEIENLGIGDRVELPGWLPPEELRSLTRTAFCGFNLIESKGKSYYYSLANKFFDYMQAGIPQICMNFPEYALINKDFEVAILIDDFSDLSGAINSILNDRNHYERLRNNCIQASEVYNWENEEPRLLDFYRLLASKR